MRSNSRQSESVWQLQEAKARLSEVVRKALDEGPQHLSVRGEPAVVVLCEQQYRELTASRPTIVDHILAGDLWPDDLVETINERPRQTDRSFDF
jgi:prevent-host-death family protein